MAPRGGSARRPAMLDLVFLAAGVGLFALTAGYGSLCERL
jgi:hypothetical protein